MIRFPHPVAIPPESARVTLARLVVGCDDSPACEAAARFALALARRTGARVTLVHVDRPGSPTDAGWARRLRELDPAVDATVRQESGDPADVLMAVAEEEAADLLLAGSHGAGRLRGAVLGSVSATLLGHAPCSVMVFRDPAAGAPPVPRSVLVGIDGSADGARAVGTGHALAEAYGARLVLLHAYDVDVPFVTHPTRPQVEMVRRHGREVLDAAAAAAPAPFNTELVQGDPRHVLARECEAHEPAVLVVGSRGLGGFRELLVGSTARWLARCAPCPVVVTRPPADGG